MAEPKEGQSPYNLDEFTARFRARLKKHLEDNPPEQKGLKEITGNPVAVGSRVLDAEDWAAKQIERAKAAGNTWAKAVVKPRRDPVEAALKAAAKRKDRLEQSIRDGKWEKAMARVDKDAMYDTIEKVGASGFSKGIEVREAKIKSRVKELQPMVEGLAEAIDDMPDGTDSEREARLLAARRGMIEIGKKRRGI